MNATQLYYFNLYEQAPIGYCTLDEQLDILEVNIMASSMLGLERNILKKLSFSKFISPEDLDIYNFFFEKVFKSINSQSCDLRILKNDGSKLWIRLEGVVSKKEISSNKEIRLILSDISEKKIAKYYKLISKE